MKKSQIRQIIIFAILLLCFLALTLLIPFPKTAAYWAAFAFGAVAICAQVLVMKIAFDKGEPLKSKFYGYPIARIGIIYLITQLAVSIALMTIGFAVEVPVWIALLVCILILGVSALGLISADIMREEVERQDVQLKKDVHTMRALQSQTAAIAGSCADEALKKKLINLAEQFRFSDPVSSDAVAAIEQDLAACVDELQNAVLENDAQSADLLITKTAAALAERNRLCKLNK